MNSLTDRQRQILEVINSRKFQAPTVRQIAEQVRLSPTKVQQHVNATWDKINNRDEPLLFSVGFCAAKIF
jgi:DNA-binding NarL/FixJ family response regulator